MSEENLNDQEADSSMIDPPQNSPDGTPSLSGLEDETQAIDPPQNVPE